MKITRRTFLKAGLSTVGATGLGFGMYGWRQAQHFDRSSHTVALPGLQKPLRLVQLSDLHFGPYVSLMRVRAWVSAAMQQKPDLIVITGDIVDTITPISDQEILALELAKLQAPLGVFAILGNHDYFFFYPRAKHKEAGTPEMVQRFEAAGLKYLTNTGVQVREDVFLAGVDDLWKGTPDLIKALEQRPDTGASLLLCHNPDLLPQVPATVGLTLCGHTHGGQVRLPFDIGLLSVSKYGERFQKGFVEAPAKAFISRGLGTTGPPIRTFCNAELVTLELVPV
jgi:uncharacterized protein